MTTATLPLATSAEVLRKHLDSCRRMGRAEGCANTLPALTTTPVYRETRVMAAVRSTPPQLTEQDRARFWEKVAVLGPDDCWIWWGGLSEDGYGSFHLGYRRCLAHRISWLLHTGVWPSLCVLHSCDNPTCVNPDHLFLGTLADNNQDMSRKGRNGSVRGALKRPRGEQHEKAKLTESLVRLLRARHAAGATYTDLGLEFGVADQTVRHAVLRKSWRHVL